ncbi:MAG: allophanate hydrolase, partial [bacterium]
NQHYRENDFKPRDLINHLVEKSRQYSQKNIWIHLLTEDEIQPYLEALEEKTPDNSPLYGVPFAIKDNIDLAGIPTTAACPEFAYTPEHHAFVVQTLIEAGAVPIGKTNLDQFATGLVGTRSPEPWGACRNAFDDDYISGGSSSGSAVAVSLGLASFSLGTDTAGSGRVPAALNNLFGLKPSKGLLSTSGVVPACRSLDVVSIFALSADDAGTVFEIAAAYDEQDCYARKNPYKNTGRTAGIGTGVLRLGVPRSDQLEFFGDSGCAELFQKNLEQWRRLGAELIEIDFAPFAESARLLYEGPWVTERFLATQALLESNPQAMHPVVREIIAPGQNTSGADAFAAQYRLAALKKLADAEMTHADLLITPTIPAQYRLQELLNDPIRLNSHLGYYTNYMNLLDYSALAVPGGFTPSGIPGGFTLVAEKFEDQRLLASARLWQSQNVEGTGAIRLA